LYYRVATPQAETEQVHAINFGWKVIWNCTRSGAKAKAHNQLLTVVAVQTAARKICAEAAAKVFEERNMRSIAFALAVKEAG